MHVPESVISSDLFLCRVKTPDVDEIHLPPTHGYNYRVIIFLLTKQKVCVQYYLHILFLLTLFITNFLYLFQI